MSATMPIRHGLMGEYQAMQTQCWRGVEGNFVKLHLCRLGWCIFFYFMKTWYCWRLPRNVNVFFFDKEF
ncbi:hypothetical protein ACQUJS_15540 [Ralstonia pseudosolanacearum]